MTQRASSAGAEFLSSELLTAAGFRHAFFTRRGGSSEAPFASLNFSVTVGDEPARVAANLERAARALEVHPERIYFLSQVHGVAIEEATGDTSPAEFARREGDIVVSRVAGVACGVRSADCVPVLLADRDTGIVAAVHAGWRGVAERAVTYAVTRLRALSPTGRLIAAIGPHISLAAFEVGADVAEALRRASPDPDVVDRSFPRPHVDLRRIVRAQLAQAGLAARDIDDVHGCSFHDSERFFSFRRDGARSGRHLSAIVASPR